MAGDNWTYDLTPLDLWENRPLSDKTHLSQLPLQAILNYINGQDYFDSSVPEDGPLLFSDQALCMELLNRAYKANEPWVIPDFSSYEVKNEDRTIISDFREARIQQAATYLKQHLLQALNTLARSNLEKHQSLLWSALTPGAILYAIFSINRLGFTPRFSRGSFHKIIESLAEVDNTQADQDFIVNAARNPQSLVLLNYLAENPAYQHLLDQLLSHLSATNFNSYDVNCRPNALLTYFKKNLKYQSWATVLETTLNTHANSAKTHVDGFLSRWSHTAPVAHAPLVASHNLTCSNHFLLNPNFRKMKVTI